MTMWFQIPQMLAGEIIIRQCFPERDLDEELRLTVKMKKLCDQVLEDKDGPS